MKIRKHHAVIIVASLKGAVMQLQGLGPDTEVKCLWKPSMGSMIVHLGLSTPSRMGFTFRQDSYLVHSRNQAEGVNIQHIRCIVFASILAFSLADLPGP